MRRKVYLGDAPAGWTGPDVADATPPSPREGEGWGEGFNADLSIRE